MLARERGRPLRHWEDTALQYVVHQDLLRKTGWTELRAVSLGLPPCACCHQDPGAEREDHEATEEGTTGTASPGRVVGTTTSRISRCGNTAHGIAGTVREEESNSSGDGDGRVPEAGLEKIVFAVNAGCPIPTRRFGDVVAAAEEHLRLCTRDRTAEGCEKGQMSCVLAAFCDGSSIIYYTASSGIDTS